MTAKPFDAEHIALEGKNLIEASAGTGKTFSIALLTLRLLLEKKIPIEKILLVTFTEAAAAELKERAVLFIRLALKELETHGSAENKAIEGIVSKIDYPKEEAIALLNKSLLDVDKSYICTIHSFCQQMLNEFAFESNQVFSRTLVTSVDDIIDRALAAYWRTHITTLPLALNVEPVFGEFKSVVQKSLSGKTFLPSIPEVTTDHREYYYLDAIDKVGTAVKDYMKAQHLVSFDDLVNDLHDKKDKRDLQKVIREKFDVLFVDEFQDTDKKQFEIFDTFMGQDNKIIFYIGDPKQSIYSFRNADLDVYFKAKEKVDKVWTMNKNYRSSKDYIEAMNLFFEPTPQFHPFSQDPNAANIIPYQKIEGGAESQEGLRDAKGLLKPILIQRSVENLENSLVEQVKYLLSEGVTLRGKEVVPSDIAILVSKNAQATEIKALLNQVDIPSVIVEGSSVFSTQEAKDLKDILEAVLHTSKSSINKALMTSLIGYLKEGFTSLDYDELVLFFRNARLIWEERGILLLIKQLIGVFGIEETKNPHAIIGQRVLSNVNQLVEILQKQSIQNALTPTEQLLFLKQQITSGGSDLEESSYTQRIESDEEAIKIVTIHKSKGLEYPIVLAPYLELANKPIWQYTFFDFKRNDASCFTLYKNATESNALYKELIDLYVTEKENENRRLIYVAITRAKYNAFLFLKGPTINKNGSLSAKNGSLAYYSESLRQRDVDTYFSDDKQRTFVGYRHRTLNQQAQSPTLVAFPSDRHIPDRNEHKLSYSFLAAKQSKLPKEQGAEIHDDYDKFVFHDLPKGADIGNFLHYIFEFIDYNDASKWTDNIKNAIRYFAPSKVGDTYFENMIYQLVEHTVYATIEVHQTTFSLSQIKMNKRVNELEFNIPLPHAFSSADLESLFEGDENTHIKTNKHSSIKGMLNGLVDLFFEYDNKYYILDWKSNYLGDTLERYDVVGLHEAMNESNYHLQYLLYSFALKRYLEQKLGDAFDFETHFGGVVYLFLRGLRHGQSSGVYTTSVSKDSVEALEKNLKLTPRMY